MKKRFLNLVLAAATVVFVASCGNDANTNGENGVSSDAVENNATASGEAVDPEKAPTMVFEKEVHDFGDITEGEKVSYSFKFTNTGKTDLVISSAQASCGCTVPNYSKDPIAPGDEGTIDVTFNSENRPGKVDKKITIMANTVPNTVVIKITGNVISPVN